MKKRKGIKAGIALVGLSVSCSANALATNEQLPVSSHGLVKFMSGASQTDPMDPLPDPGGDFDLPGFPWNPTRPDGKPNPGTTGPLAIDFASSIQFGLNELSNEDAVYFAEAQRIVTELGETVMIRPNYVQVSDNRGTESGWTLTLSQAGQFSAMTNSKYPTLTGAAITFEKGFVNGRSTSKEPMAMQRVTLDPTGAAQVIMSALPESGAGTWTTAWGAVEDLRVATPSGVTVTRQVTKGVSLFVPGDTPKDAIGYETALNWTLTDRPGNRET